MRVRHKFPMVILPLVVLALAAVIISCASAEAGPRAWIDWPTEGFETDAGTTVTVIAHGYADAGVGEMRLEVDRGPYRVVTPHRAGEQFVDVSMEWYADEPGVHLLSVTTIDVNGQESNPASVSVRVAGEGPGLMVSPSPLTTTLESPTVVPPTEEPAATAAASETAPPPTATSPPPATGTPLPPTATPPPPAEPPRIVSFEVNRSRITVGECVRFSWRVEGSPTAIYFDGEGATSPDSRERCPTATKDFELRAEGPGGADTERLTVVVVQPSPTPGDTEGPLIQNETGPQQMWAPDGNACRGEEPYTFQAKVTDPSGVLWVKLIYSIDQGAEKTGGMQPVSGSTYRMSLTLLNLQGNGGTLRWYIRACDKVNPMNCSDSATHDVTVLDCPD